MLCNHIPVLLFFLFPTRTEDVRHRVGGRGAYKTESGGNTVLEVGLQEELKDE